MQIKYNMNQLYNINIEICREEENKRKSWVNKNYCTESDPDTMHNAFQYEFGHKLKENGESYDSPFVEDQARMESCQ